MTIIAINSDGTMNTERSRITSKSQRLPLSKAPNRFDTPLIKVGQSYFIFSVDKDSDDQLAVDRDRFKVVKALRAGRLNYQTALLGGVGSKPRLAFLVETEEDDSFDGLMEALHDLARSFGVTESYGIDSSLDFYRDVYTLDPTKDPQVELIGHTMIAESFSEASGGVWLFDQLNQHIWFPQEAALVGE